MRKSSMAVLLGTLLITGSAFARDDAAPALPDLTSFALMRSNPATFMTVEETADALKDADVIFLGEWHDHAGNHLAEMGLFRALYAHAPQLALSMEQFERDVQPVVDDYLAGKIGEEALISRGRAWSNYAEAYRPLVEYAKDHRLSVIAANAPASVVRCVGEQGPEFLAHLDAEKRPWAAAELHLADGAYKDKFMRFLAEDNAHGGAGANAANPSQANLRSFAAQVVRDDTMAESIFLYLQKNPGRKVVHITGAFHAEGRLGTVERLRARAPNLKIAVVVPAEAENPDHPHVADVDRKEGDYLFVLRGLPKDYVSDAEKKAAEKEQQANFRTRSQCKL
jgi:uncharacterized iron-regulated protein